MPASKPKTKTNCKPKKERYGKTVWSQVYANHKPAMKNRRTGEIRFPSAEYIRKHHPRGAWDS